MGWAFEDLMSQEDKAWPIWKAFRVRTHHPPAPLPEAGRRELDGFCRGEP